MTPYTPPRWIREYERPTHLPMAGSCPCACSSGGFCGGCGHAGCGGRGR